MNKEANIPLLIPKVFFLFFSPSTDYLIKPLYPLVPLHTHTIPKTLHSTLNPSQHFPLNYPLHFILSFPFFSLFFFCSFFVFLFYLQFSAPFYSDAKTVPGKHEYREWEKKGILEAEAGRTHLSTSVPNNTFLTHKHILKPTLSLHSPSNFNPCLCSLNPTVLL